MSLVSFPSWGDSIFSNTTSSNKSLSINDLVKRQGVYYKKFTDVPFTGDVQGKAYEMHGSFKNGKKEGSWVSYYDNGQLYSKSVFKNGIRVKPYFEQFHENGEVWVRGTDFKDGLMHGSYESYYPDGQLYEKGNYTKGERDGSWVEYWDSGRLKMKGDYENGKEEGFWVRYNEDGTKFPLYNGTYKNGVKVSD